MSFLSAIRVAVAALLVNKGRSALTSLGIVIGISAVIALVAAGSGARVKLEERLDSVGKNLILVRPGGRTESGIMREFTPLAMEDADAIHKRVGPLLVGVAPEQLTTRLALTRAGKWGVGVAGVVPDLQPVRNWKVAQGRFINDDDVKKTAAVCIIGQTAKQHLFPDRPNPIGEVVRLPTNPFRVVGVLGEKGRSPTGEDQDNQIFIPITTFQHQLVRQTDVNLILATARSESTIEQAKDEIIKVMRERRRLKPGEPNDFDVSSVREMAELAQILTATLQGLVGVIASISLLVGGIGIMNIMLVSVTERTREIGIRMAVGATGADVLIQFLIEAVVLALLGGILGITLGLVGAAVLADYFGWPLVVAPEIVVVAFGVAAGVGVFFGYYPAWKASRLDPIDALRYE
jgi:putative ABC transport system permease protein